jgi:hypothetical protein
VGANESLAPANVPTRQLRRSPPPQPTITTALSSTITLASSRKIAVLRAVHHSVIAQMRKDGDDLGELKR